MAQEYTDQQIEEKVNPPLPLIIKFYEKPVVKEVINGVNIYTPRLMALKKVQGEKDSLSVVVTERFINQYPDEYARFQREKLEDLMPLCAITDQMTAQSLIDMGIKSVDDLATSDPLPLFDYLREPAKLILEARNAHKNRRPHDNHVEEVRGSTEESGQAQGNGQEPGTDRREHMGAETQNHQKENHQKENHQKENHQKEDHQKEDQQEIVFEFNYCI